MRFGRWAPLLGLFLCAGCGAAPAEEQPASAKGSLSEAHPMLAMRDGEARVSAYVVLEGPPAVEVVPRGMALTSPEAATVVRARLAELAQLRAAIVPQLEQRGATVIGELARLGNAVIVVAPRKQLAAFEKVAGVDRVEVIVPVERTLQSALPTVGAPRVWRGSPPYHGEGIRIGIIDSGIDYLHADLGGAGVQQDYLDNDRTIIEAGTFPTARVIGGWDFVGDDYDASDPNNDQPQPDPDPLDCGIINNNGFIFGGHGSHVSGIAAGNGVLSDGTPFAGPYDQSFNPAQFRVAPGVAPMAQLYALRVFGCNGSTSLLGAALERAADPDMNGNFDDHLDVVNASLGSPYGLGTTTNAQLVKNLTDVGTLFVAAAGNEDHVFFVTGSPGSYHHALSVAASTDSDLVELEVSSPNTIAGFYPAAEGSFTTPLGLTGAIEGQLVYAEPNTACTAITNEAAIAGQVALIDRGGCQFIEKFQFAEAAGATAVVVVDDELADVPAAMGGGTPNETPLPGVMIRLTDGDLIKPELANGVSVRLDDDRYQGPGSEQMTGFTSRGPSSVDDALKPEISAPGQSIDSAGVASGNESSNMSGTSMACPMVTGAAALVRQAQPQMGPMEIKAVLMNTAEPLAGTDGVLYPVSMQGAGRVFLPEAVNRDSYLTAVGDDGDVGVAFGALVASEPMATSRQVKVVNRGTTPKSYSASIAMWHPLAGVDVSVMPTDVTVEPGQSADLDITLELDPATLGQPGPGPYTEPAMLDMPRHYLTEVSGQLVLSDTSAPAGQERPLALPLHASVRAAAERLAGEPFRCEQGAGGVFIPMVGESANPEPLVSAFVLGTDDEQDVDPQQDPAGAALDIRAIGVASDYAVRDSFDEVSLHFGVAVEGTWTTVARGNYSLVMIDIDVGSNGSSDYWIAAEPYQSDVPFADALAATTYDLSSGQPIPTKRYLNLVPADQANTYPFHNGVIAFSVFARDIGLTEGSSEFRYRAFSVTLASGVQFDDTSWATFDPSHAAFDPVVGSKFPGRPLYRGGDPVLLQLADGAAEGELPQLLLLHHTNVAGMRWQIVDPTPTAVEQVRIEHGFPQQAKRGERLSSFIEVTNDGAVEVASAHLEGSLHGATLDIAAPSQGSCAKTTTIDCELGSLAPGEKVRVTVSVDALGAGPVDLEAHLTTANGCVTPIAGSVTVEPSDAPPPGLVSAGGCGCELAGRDERSRSALWLMLGLAALGLRVRSRRE